MQFPPSEICTLHYIVDSRTLASSLIKAELVYLSLPLSLVQIIPGQKLANRNLPPEPNIPVSTTMRQLTFKTKSLFHFGMSVSEMFHSPSTFAFYLFFLSEASFIPLAAHQVLLCLACLFFCLRQVLFQVLCVWLVCCLRPDSNILPLPPPIHRKARSSTVQILLSILSYLSIFPII